MYFCTLLYQTGCAVVHYVWCGIVWAEKQKNESGKHIKTVRPNCAPSLICCGYRISTFQAACESLILLQNGSLLLEAVNSHCMQMPGPSITPCSTSHVAQAISQITPRRPLNLLKTPVVRKTDLFRKYVHGKEVKARAHISASSPTDTSHSG